MILFLNFAPISFYGGAEKWMNETAKKISQFEETMLVSTGPAIANLYSTLVLNRKFDNRAAPGSLHQNITLTMAAFIPFTVQWRQIRDLFKNAGLIYARYELPEFLILIYFAGISGLSKTIAGIHSPFAYHQASSFFEKLHNLINKSLISRKALSQVKKVHALNQRDLKMLQNGYGLTNIEYIPNSMASQKYRTGLKQDGKLHILFVGELSKRKGIDRVIEVIKNSPENYIFTIAGDGPYIAEIEKLADKYQNVLYKGYLNPSKLPEIYLQNDLLFLPSRAESMPLSILEALSFGLLIVNSPETTLELNDQIEYTASSNLTENYLSIFNKIFSNKQNNKLSSQKIQHYFKNFFSEDAVDEKLFKNIFELKI